MNGQKIATHEIARAVMAIALSLGSVAGYLHFGGADVILSGADPSTIEKIARPDPWTGEFGRKNQTDIAKLVVDVGALQVQSASREVRITALEGRRIPPEAFEQRVQEIRDKLDVLTEQVTILRIMVGRLVVGHEHNDK